jgi:hypothetical protein
MRKDLERFFLPRVRLDAEQFADHARRMLAPGPKLSGCGHDCYHSFRSSFSRNGSYESLSIRSQENGS